MAANKKNLNYFNQILPRRVIKYQDTVTVKPAGRNLMDIQEVFEECVYVQLYMSLMLYANF